MPSREQSLIDLVLHELRTPLTVAAGSLRQIPPPVETSHQAALARALRACEKLERLAQELRDWVRVSGTSGATQPVPLGPLVADAAGKAEAARPGEVPVIVEMPSDLAAVGSERLGDAVAALLTALVRAALAGETVTIAATTNAGGVRLLARRPIESAAPGAEFAAEWLGGLGFSLPLARAVIESAGGAVSSSLDGSGRLAAISVVLKAPAAPPPAR